jgi:hypothetical protein
VRKLSASATAFTRTLVGHRPQRERDAVEPSARAVEEVEDVDGDAAVPERLRERGAGVPHEPVEAVAAHQTMFTSGR